MSSSSFASRAKSTGDRTINNTSLSGGSGGGGFKSTSPGTQGGNNREGGAKCDAGKKL